MLKFLSLCLIASTLLVSGCTALRPVDRKEKVAPTKVELRRKELVKTARDFLGSPYQYGGTGNSGFDCSGLTFRVYQNQQISLPRTAAAQAKYGRKVQADKAKPADLAFFSLRNRVVHVAIITKATRRELWVIHSTTSRGVVHEEVYSSSYWSQRLREVRNALIH